VTGDGWQVVLNSIRKTRKKQEKCEIFFFFHHFIKKRSFYIPT
jgi:hypothetical protein